MTDDRIRAFDPTAALAREQVISKFGPGENEKLPDRIRPTITQFLIVVVGTPILGVLWWQLGYLLGSIGLLVALALPWVAARQYRRIRVDGRNVFRGARSTARHRVRSRGRVVGPWMAHGRAAPAGQRRAPKADPVIVEVSAEEWAT